MMGSNEEDNEKPMHLVKLAQFRLGCYPVTMGQYHRFYKHSMIQLMDKQQPVVQVDWYAAYIFCKWAHGRLPTEAEWEYACRAGTTTLFNIGNNLTANKANCDGKIGKTTPMGSYKPNKWGLYDMHGNVREWCQDRYDKKYYDECKQQEIIDNPQGPETGSDRVSRGGSWSDSEQECRSAYRSSTSPDDRFSYIGFRIVFVP